MSTSIANWGEAKLGTFEQLWTEITFWCVIGTGTVYLCAGVLFVRALTRRSVHYMWIPAVSCILGGIIGIFSGGIASLVLAAIYVSVPYAIGADTAFGLGIGLALLITYFQIGRADFSHHSPPV
jgi:hypothetical protein